MDAMTEVIIKRVDAFDLEAYARLRNICFDDLEKHSLEFTETVKAESDINPIEMADLKKLVGPLTRFAAYEGDELIGVSSGFHERGRVFYMASSAVAPAYRRQGIYTKLLKAIGESAQAEGAVKMRSQHSVLNNKIIIIKLALGWHITGLTTSEQMGSLVELSYNFSNERKDLFKNRVIPYK
jgi:GNAT superfamily N-acetyltransferase